jgi:beta-galactosidase
MAFIFLRKNILFNFFLLMLAGRVAGQNVPSRNDHIFPPAATAKPYINYDAKGFLINGKRVFIASAGMEYARVPRALWHDRLLRLKRAGFNAVEMYTFWSFHEAHEGQFNFTGDHDFNAYLKMIKSMGMYAIVRVGPYYCGEWNMGGYPIWLRFKPGLKVREDNPQFLTAVDHFFDKLIPIVVSNQINHGGAVIMVQLENEHRAAWGTVTPNEYFRHLINKTVSLGLQVPYFFSGLHPGNDPAGDISNLDDAKRPNPWFSTEYWGVWFLNYGPQDQDSTIYDRRTWKIIAHGGNGYNVYMAHGGTNFDYNNDRDNAASYDYGASVGQAGDLRPLYYSFKRANWFARGFQDILANSTDKPDNKPTVSDTIIKVTARKSPGGTVAFLDNPDSVAVKFELKAPANSIIQASAPIKLAAGEIMPVVQHYQLSPQVNLLWAPTRIYGIITQANTTTLLIYGAADANAQLYFNVPRAVKIIRGNPNFKLSGNVLNFNAHISSAMPVEYSFEANGHRIRIIAVNDQLASRSWFAEANGQTPIIIGPDYAADLISKKNKLSLLIERPWNDKSKLPVWIFKPNGGAVKLNPEYQAGKHLTKIKPGIWQAKSGSLAALPGFNDQGWLTSKDPLQMGADCDISADAWYRTTLKVAQTGNYILRFTSVKDRAALFLNGKRMDTGAVFNKIVGLHLDKDTTYTLALFTAHDGRNKLIFRVGEIDTLDAKGLSSPVTLQKADGSGPIITVNNWRMKGGPGNPFEMKGWKKFIGVDPKYEQIPLKHSFGSLWVEQSVPHSPQFYRTTLNLPALKGSHTICRVNTTSMGHGSVWINGHNLGRYPEKIKINGLYIPECWLKPGVNKIVIYDEDGLSPKKVTIETETAASRDTQALQF